jgi:hypothetical protein
LRQELTRNPFIPGIQAVKVLFFHAAAGQPRFAAPLMGQAFDTLRSFNRFLAEAIKTAKERQVRYALPWERVRDLHTLRLDPLDTRIRVPRRMPGTVITNWPPDRAPDLDQMGFVSNRAVGFHVTAAVPTAHGLRITTDVALQPDDDVIWCKLPCTIAVEPAAPPPAQVADVDGQPLTLLAPPTSHDDRHWCFVVAGRSDTDTLRVDGEEVEAAVLPAHEGVRRLIDAAGRSLEVTGELLRLEELPADGPLRADNGVRFRWHETGPAGRKGLWVQLLPPNSDELDELVDPRVAFCEDGVEEVWTDRSKRNKEDVYRVKRVDRERYQLMVERWPPDKSTLFLPVDVRNLQLQARALKQLMEAPLPHHQGLLRLCEDPRHARWPTFEPRWPTRWRSLREETRSGTDEQRRFVAKALGSPGLRVPRGSARLGQDHGDLRDRAAARRRGAAGAAVRVDPRGHRQRARALARLGLSDRRGAHRQARQGRRQGPGLSAGRTHRGAGEKMARRPGDGPVGDPSCERWPSGPSSWPPT